MKILKMGTPPQKRPLQGECQTCGTVIEFTKEEASPSPDPRDSGLLMITCPVCHGTIWHQAQ